MRDLENVWSENLQKGILQIPTCQHCRSWNWYPLPACRSCQSTDFFWNEVELIGTLFSWTRVHRRFTNFDIAVPYVVGLVEMAEAPTVRIPARLQAGSGAQPIIGDDVTLTAACDEGGWHWVFNLRQK
ncbi:Zn-ribbon domain-containing OB-fold protein [Polaromonas hydrogenivorans]|uniref:OB-fold domain-containing protein n=1 Tax=Polaromonas hydrogenivorans TaxID=335476 RepID=A0AAU7M0D5_9BURK